MKVLVIASQKGGAGKTTIAASLGVAAELAGAGPVVLIDTDPQGSLAAWWNTRQAGAPALASASLAELPGRLDALRQAGAELVVIDTPPSVSASISAVVKHADLVLIPVRPSPHDLRAVGASVDIAEAAGVPFVFCLSQAKAAARLSVQAVTALSAHGAVAPAVLHDRVDFASSMIDGRTVIETDPKGKSAGEVRELLAFVERRMQDKSKRAKLN